MYTKLTLTIVLMFAIAISKAQIPNSGFENWDNMGNYSNPIGWSTMNNTTAVGGIYTATKGTPGNPGSSYLKLTSKTTPAGVVNGIAVSGKYDSVAQVVLSGFPYAMRPTSLNGAWQHMIYGSSQGSIAVTFTKWNPTLHMRDIIGSASKTLSGMAMSWANFSIPIVYFVPDMPDSCIIVMRASGTTPTDQDYLWVDNLSFAGVVNGVDEKGVDAFSVYPNPAHSNQTVQFNLLKAGNVKAEVYGIDGKKIAVLLDNYLTEGVHAMDLYHNNQQNEWVKGTYFLHLTTENATQIVKMIID